MLSQFIIAVPGGKDVIINLDTTLAAHEIRVGSLGALDPFMTDTQTAAAPTPRPNRKGVRAQAIIRLSNEQIDRARELLKDTRGWTSEQVKVMQAWFPSSGGMRTSKDMDAQYKSLGFGAERARKIRNTLLRKAGVLP